MKLNRLFLCFLILVSCKERVDSSLSRKRTIPKSQKQIFTPGIISHRGVWKNSNLPKNSIAAFKKAIEMNLAGSEFDVNMTVDDSLVITHGPRYNKLHIEKSTYEELISFKLANGEKLPTLYEWLMAGHSNNDSTLFICELKGSQISQERALYIADKVAALYQKLKLEDQVIFISFDYETLKRMVQLIPKVKTQFLGNSKSPQDLKNDGISGANYRFDYLKNHPEVIDQARSLGLIMNSGTVNDPLIMDWLIANKFDYISTDEPELLKERIAQSPARKGWNLIWSDEFYKDGIIDTTKWGFENGYLRNQERQFYTSRLENVRVENGNLIIEARKEHIPNPFFKRNSNIWKEKNEFTEYTSASITTKDLAEWQYGRIETRAQLAGGRGLWPAIWMLGANWEEVGWPATGEIDIMEHVGFDPDSIFATIHTEAYNHMKGTQKGKKVFINEPYESFHIFTLEWSPERIDFLLDDHIYNTIINENKTTAEWPFDQKFHLKLNVAVGGMLGGREGIDDSILPSQMLVDYVRVYKKAQL